MTDHAEAEGLDRSHYNFHTADCLSKMPARCSCSHDYDENGIRWEDALIDAFNTIARARQPARQPVTRGEYCHANEKEAALLNEWLSRISQEDCDLMEALFRRTGLVYWDDPMRPKPEALLEGRVL